MDSSNPQSKVRQSFNCEESTVFFCFKCNRNLCGPCRTKHLHDLSPIHETVVYRVKLGEIDIEEMCKIHPDSSYIGYCETCTLPLYDDCIKDHELQLHPILPIDIALHHILTEMNQTPSHIISTITNEHLFYRRALMVEMQSDIKKLNTKMSSQKHISNMFTKAQKLKQLIDKVVHDFDLILPNQIM